MYFAKAKATSPEIPLLSFDHLGPIPRMVLWKITTCLAIYGTHSQQEASGSAPNLLVNNPLLGSHIFVCILLQLTRDNTLSVFATEG